MTLAGLKIKRVMVPASQRDASASDKPESHVNGLWKKRKGREQVGREEVAESWMGRGMRKNGSSQDKQCRRGVRSGCVRSLKKKKKKRAVLL